MNRFTRREFLGVSLTGIGTLYFQPFSSLAWGEERGRTSDHFFLKICIPGGADPSYFYDARPLSMTAAELIQNYLKEEPELLTGVNGTSCYATSLTKVFAPYRDRFSVINGVVMSPSFDGHDQNMNFLFAGDPFGGGSFLTHLNQLSGFPERKPIDTFQSGSVFANLDNLSKTVVLTPKSLLNLIAKLKIKASREVGDTTGRSSRLDAFIQDRMRQNSTGQGSFSLGSGRMLTGFMEAPDLVSRFTQIQVDSSETDEVAIFTKVLAGLFKNGVIRSALWIPLDPAMLDTDAHAPDVAAKQPTLFKGIGDRLSTLFRLLGETPFDSQRSLWDVTTVMMTSEFGRTMKQDKKKVDETGTDHNPLSNSVWVGGNGIKGGQIIGASDRRSVGEVVSGAHASLDKDALKIMGLPFDFATMKPRTDLPVTYNANDYLTINSVVNTIYSLFGVPEASYRLTQRNGDRARVLAGLLA